MRRTLFTIALVVSGLYLVLHLALGSRPVQRRVLDELRRELARYGLDLDIESIEFSAFSPKIYLNRVTLRARPKSELPLPEPIAIDKVKIEFQPLALIYRKIVIEETVLFHPRLVHHDIDRLQRRIEQIAAAKRPGGGGPGFEVVVKKAGVVDALLDLAWKEGPTFRAPQGVDLGSRPALALRTPSFTAFVETHARQQQAFSVETRNFEIERGPLRLPLSKFEMEIDVAKKSLRVNRMLVDGDGLHLDVKGVSALPTKAQKGVPKATLSFDVRLPLRLLSRIPELKAPLIEGTVSTEGALSLDENDYSANGVLKYDNVIIDEYRVGSGKVSFRADEKRAVLTDALLQWAGGEFRGNRLEIGLKDAFSLSGELAVKDLRLEGILEAVRETDIPVVMATDGLVKVSGTLNPLEIRADLKNTVRGLQVLRQMDKPREGGNVTLDAGAGAIEGRLTFTKERMAFGADLKILNGTARTDGALLFGGKGARLTVKGEKLSLTQLEHISDLRLGGTTSLTADIDATEAESRVSGVFDAEEAEVANILLGRVHGEAFYRNGLLSFEKLELPSTEPITARGFVDFVPAHTHYKFEVDARRAGVDDVFAVFRKRPLNFPLPKGGEVAARMTLEGGHDEEGIELKASGQAKHFTWYGERWSSAPFSLLYRADGMDLQRVLLLKKSGGVEVKGTFVDKYSELTFQSHGIRLEEMDALRKAPFTGEVAGSVTVRLEPQRGLVSGKGEVRLVQATFRNTKLADSSLQLRSSDAGVEFIGGLAGEGLRGRYFRSQRTAKNGGSELVLSFADFDFAPVVAMLLGQDVGSLTDITATGDVALAGDFMEWRSLSGSGTVNRLNLGLKGTPMRNREPIRIKIQSGAIGIPRFALQGPENQASVEFNYQPGVSVKGALDGKLDLQFLQPFIPGLEYGTGPVTAGLRMSGHPDRYELIGNVALEDGTIRLTGLSDEFRGVRARLSVGQDRINIDRFESTVGGGAMNIEGDIRINRFTTLVPNLKISADRTTLHIRNYLAIKFSGDFVLRGNSAPYSLGGRCRIHDGALTSFSAGEATPPTAGKPTLAFDIHCEAREQLLVKTDVMNAEFRGTLHVVGNTDQVGLLGGVEAVRGSLIFRETKFALSAGTVRFESPSRLAPRFNVSGRAFVKEEKTTPASEYEVNINVFGTPADYKIRLTASPTLTEPEIISLLLLGFTGRGQEAGNYGDLGSTVMGQIPLQSKIQSELGVDIKVKSMKTTNSFSVGAAGIGNNADPTAPSVQIQKDITKKTKLSYSSTLDAVPVREFKIEQMLDENLTINATAIGNARGTSTTTSQQPSQSYGVDVRYRFSFE